MAYRCFQSLRQEVSRSHGITDSPHGESLTYAELDAQAERMASALSPYLTGPDQVVAVAMSQDNWNIVAVHLGILKAARAVEGGKNLEVEIMCPLAASMGENDFLFLVKAPSIAEWGTFMDNYEGDAVAAEDKKFADVASCADSALWESVKIK